MAAPPAGLRITPSRTYARASRGCRHHRRAGCSPRGGPAFLTAFAPSSIGIRGHTRAAPWVFDQKGDNALKGRSHDCSPFQGSCSYGAVYPGRCPGLACRRAFGPRCTSLPKCMTRFRACHALWDAGGVIGTSRWSSEPGERTPPDPWHRSHAPRRGCEELRGRFWQSLRAAFVLPVRSGGVRSFVARPPASFDCPSGTYAPAFVRLNPKCMTRSTRAR